MERLLLSIALIFVIALQLYTQCSDSLAYFPSNLGDTWSYQIINGAWEKPVWYETHRIDSVYWFGNYKYVYNNHQGWFRIDTSNCEIVRESPFSNLEFTYYKLTAHIGNHWKYDPSSQNSWAGVRRIFPGNIFGAPTTIKEFWFFSAPDTVSSDPNDWKSYLWTRREYLALGFGLVFREFEPSPAWFLVGTVIDGDTLGTIVVSVSEPDGTIPEGYYLSQNYPNPFNPETTIIFTLPVRSRVKLVIYDMLGRLVDTVIDKEMEDGSYSVQWIPRALSGGVYIYELRAGHYTLRKKLIYLK
jgi:hypothetical protein